LVRQWVFRLLILFFFFQFLTASGQEDLKSIEQYVKIIGDRDDSDFTRLFTVVDELESLDSVARNQRLSRIKERAGAFKDPVFSVRFKFVIARCAVRDSYPKGLEETIARMEEVVQEAYLIGDDRLLAKCYITFGGSMVAYHQIDLAAAYTLRGIELIENHPQQTSSYRNYLFLGELLFHTRDYQNSIKFTLRGLNSATFPKVKDAYYLRYLNTLGQGYMQLDRLDSAVYFFEKSFIQAKLNEDETWMGINSSYLGQVSFLNGDFENAKSQLLFDYQINKSNEYDIAGNSMRWLGLVYLKTGDLDSAKRCADVSIALLKKTEKKVFSQNSKYLEEALFLKYEIFKKQNRPDSALHYYQLYAQLFNSNEKLALLSSNQVTQAKITNEKNRYALLQFQQEKMQGQKIRNILILSVFLLSMFAILVLIIKQKEIKYKNEIYHIQKLADEAKLSQAKEQLKFFTTHLAEKSTQLEELEKKFREKEFSAQRQLYLTELGNLKILTEEDWQKFKALFEKLHPVFFETIKTDFPGITQAEMRVAALLRLHLSAKEMSLILGISEASVLRTRSRLRLRLNLGSDINLEEFLSRF
jgi:DNA-binding CsgD family transcriptional regulator